MKKSIVLALFTVLSTTAIANQQEQTDCRTYYANAESPADWPKMLENLRLITEHADGKGFTVPISTLSPELQKEIRETASKHGIDTPAYEVEIISATEKWNTVSRMFSTDQTIEQEKVDAIKDEYLERDLHKRRLVKTIFGWVSLASVEKNALANPKKHTAIITSLAGDPKLIRELNHLLSRVKKSESALLSFWKEETPEVKMHIDSLYTKKGNRNFHRNYSPFWQEVFTHTRTEKPDAEEIGELIASGFLSSITGLYHHTSADVAFFKRRRNIVNCLHARTCSVATVVQALDAELKALYKHPELGLLPHAQALKALRSLHTQKHTRSLNHLFTLLRTNTFKSKPSFFSCKGRLRVAYLLTNDFKDDLIPLLMALGELDVYLAYASSASATSVVVQ